LSGRARPVLWQVSAFTVAHSVTLGLTMYGIVSAPPKIVEPLIALSIAYVAIENIFLSELKSWRVALVFGFGLLHGMGFAGALKELGLPRSEFVTALLAFNMGVEAGQLAVIGAAVLLVGWHCADRAWYRGRIVVPASAMIACTAVYWTVDGCGREARAGTPSATMSRSGAIPMHRTRCSAVRDSDVRRGAAAEPTPSPHVRLHPSTAGIR
jgi:hypothetical protein